MFSNANFSEHTCSSSELIVNRIAEAQPNVLDPVTFSLMSRLFPGLPSTHSSDITYRRELRILDTNTTTHENTYISTIQEPSSLSTKLPHLIPQTNYFGLIPPMVFNPNRCTLSLTPTTVQELGIKGSVHTEPSNVMRSQLNFCTEENTTCTTETTDDQKLKAQHLLSIHNEDTVTSGRLSDFPAAVNEYKSGSSMDQIANLLQVANFNSTPFDSLTCESPARNRSAYLSAESASGVTKIPIKSEDDFCELCQKHFCNKYYLRKHKTDVHGIQTGSYSGSRRRDTTFNLQQNLTAVDEKSALQMDQSNLQKSDTNGDSNGEQKGAIESVTTNQLPFSRSSEKALDTVLDGMGMRWKDIFQPSNTHSKGCRTETHFSLPVPQPLTSAPVATSKYSEPNYPNGLDPVLSAHCYLMALAQSVPVMIAGTDHPTRSIALGTSKDQGMKLELPALPVMGLDVNSTISEAKCDQCHKVFCSPYFLHIHRMSQHQAELNENCISHCSTEQGSNTSKENSGNVNHSASVLDSLENSKGSLQDQSTLQLGSSHRKSRVGPVVDKGGKIAMAPLDAFKNSMVAAKMADRVTCELCKKDLCNKYFLRTHKIRVHGVSPTDVGGPPMRNPPTVASGIKSCTSFGPSSVIAACSEAESGVPREHRFNSTFDTLMDIPTLCSLAPVGQLLPYPSVLAGMQNLPGDELHDTTRVPTQSSLFPNSSLSMVPNHNDQKTWLPLFGNSGLGLPGSDINEIFSVIVNISCPICEQVIGPRLFLPSHLSDIHGLNPLNPAFFLNMLRAKVVPSCGLEHNQAEIKTRVPTCDAKVSSRPGSPTIFEETLSNEDMSIITQEEEGQTLDGTSGNSMIDTRSAPFSHPHNTADMHAAARVCHGASLGSVCNTPSKETGVTAEAISNSTTMADAEENRTRETVTTLGQSWIPIGDPLGANLSHCNTTLSNTAAYSPVYARNSFALTAGTFPPMLFPPMETTTVAALSGSQWTAAQQLNGGGCTLGLSTPSSVLPSSQPSSQIMLPNTGLPRKSPNQMRVLCDICNKWICNKYFLRTHKANKHGITDVTHITTDTGRDGVPKSGAVLRGAQNVSYCRRLATVSESSETAQRSKANFGSAQNPIESLLPNGYACNYGNTSELDGIQGKSQITAKSVFEQLNQAWRWNYGQNPVILTTPYPLLDPQLPTSLLPSLDPSLPMVGPVPPQLLSAFPSTAFPQSSLLTSLPEFVDTHSEDKAKTTKGASKTNQQSEHRSDKNNAASIPMVQHPVLGAPGTCDCKLPLNLSLKSSTKSSATWNCNNLKLSRVWRRYRVQRGMQFALRYATERALKRARRTRRLQKTPTLNSNPFRHKHDGRETGKSIALNLQVSNGSRVAPSKVKCAYNMARKKLNMRHSQPSQSMQPQHSEASTEQSVVVHTETNHSQHSMFAGNASKTFACPLCSTVPTCDFGTLNLLLQHLSLVHGGCASSFSDHIEGLQETTMEQCNFIGTIQTQTPSFQVSQLANSPLQDGIVTRNALTPTVTASDNRVSSTVANVTSSSFATSVIISESGDYRLRDIPVPELLHHTMFVPTKSYTETLSSM
ncbi:unnamed protein product [Dicrocoelium dendriticum]|nr:unnamed protein product [Dicrocoelium dendriticum]